MTKRVDTEADLGEVRHEINLKKLEQYLCSQQPDNYAAPLTLAQFGYGQSNPSYQITDSKGRKYVLRKQPPGPLISKTAHRVDREFYMQDALYKHTDIPVAKMMLFCGDKEIIGTWFYIMEFLEGRIFHSPSIEDVEAEDRRDIWLAAINTLARLHSVEAREIGLPENMTRKYSSHYPRQIETIAHVLASQAKTENPKTGKILGMPESVDEILEWMRNHIPAEKVSIVHGDFKIDNIVFHPTENKVIGILDWELCTIGHPLADLGNLLQPYTIPSSQNASPAFNLTELPGLPTLEQQLVCYQNASGYDPRPDFKFATVYAHMRLTMITHGIAARVLQGQASSAQAEKVGELYKVFGALAIQEISRPGKL